MAAAESLIEFECVKPLESWSECDEREDSSSSSDEEEAGEKPRHHKAKIDGAACGRGNVKRPMTCHWCIGPH